MSITDYLTAEHRECDHYYAEAEKAVSNGEWEKAKDMFSNFKKATLLHFKKEEEILFPEFETTTGMVAGPTQVMRHEHNQARELVKKLEEALEKQDKSAFLSIGESLMILIQQHNMKEEQILYPMSDQNLEGNELVKRMKELDEV